MHSPRPFVLAVVLVTALAPAAPAVARAGEPGDVLRGQIDRVLRTLDDPTLQSADHHAERQAAVRRIAEQTFDFRETARRTLGRHWDERTPAEREQFVRLFTALIDGAYLSKVDRFQGEKIVVDGDSEQGDDAVVHTTVITHDGSNVGVDYSMRRTPDTGWRVYDVSIGGMSLVSSYRVQFNKIIQAGSWDELVRRLQAKVMTLHAAIPDAATPAAAASPATRCTDTAGTTC